MNIYTWHPTSGFTSIIIVFFPKSKSNFFNIIMSSSECSCKVPDALKFSGVSDAQESLPILFSVTYSPKVSI